jgi:hypothetical protein
MGFFSDIGTAVAKGTGLKDLGDSAADQGLSGVVDEIRDRDRDWETNLNFYGLIYFNS